MSVFGEKIPNIDSEGKVHQRSYFQVRKSFIIVVSTLQFFKAPICT